LSTRARYIIEVGDWAKGAIVDYMEELNKMLKAEGPVVKEVYCPKCDSMVPSEYLHCNKCNNCLPRGDFSKWDSNGSARDGYSYKCKNCHNQYQRDRREARSKRLERFLGDSESQNKPDKPENGI
jgi:hypothetical protein